jgi:hypothetical protein
VIFPGSMLRVLSPFSTPPRFALTDATSNEGVVASACDWPRIGTAPNPPIANGAATTANPAAHSNNFLPLPIILLRLRMSQPFPGCEHFPFI